MHLSRTPRRSKKFKPGMQSIIFNGDVQITKGTMYGRSPDEEMEHLQRTLEDDETRLTAQGDDGGDDCDDSDDVGYTSYPPLSGS